MAIDFTNIMQDKTDYLTEEEINLLLNHCLEQEKIRDYMLILTLIRTGRRISEIVGEKPFTRKVGLRPCDIHPDGLIEFDILKKNHIKKTTNKGHERDPEVIKRLRVKKMPKRELKPVDDEYLKYLIEYINANGISKKSRVFPITRQRALQIIHEVAGACNITRSRHKIHNHTFRHSYAIALLKDNPNDAGILKQVQELLSHSNIEVTMHYAQFTQYDKKKSLNKLFKNKGR